MKKGFPRFLSVLISSTYSAVDVEEMWKKQRLRNLFWTLRLLYELEDHPGVRGHPNIVGIADPDGCAPRHRAIIDAHRFPRIRSVAPQDVQPGRDQNLIGLARQFDPSQQQLAAWKRRHVGDGMPLLAVNRDALLSIVIQPVDGGRHFIGIVEL